VLLATGKNNIILNERGREAQQVFASITHISGLLSLLFCDIPLNEDFEDVS